MGFFQSYAHFYVGLKSKISFLRDKTLPAPQESQSLILQQRSDPHPMLASVATTNPRASHIGATRPERRRQQGKAEAPGKPARDALNVPGGCDFPELTSVRNTNAAFCIEHQK